MTGAKRVLALGGGGVSLKEAELGEAGRFSPRISHVWNVHGNFREPLQQVVNKMNGKFRVVFFLDVQG